MKMKEKKGRRQMLKRREKNPCYSGVSPAHERAQVAAAH